MKICPSCNASIPDEAIYCVQCGVKFVSQVKKCHNCNALMPNDVNFCMECGTKMTLQMRICPNPECNASMPSNINFCTECGAKMQDSTSKYVNSNQNKNQTPLIHLKRRTISFECGFSYESHQTIPGVVTITNDKISFIQKTSGVIGFLNSMATLGTKISETIYFRDIVNMSIVERGHILYIQTNDGSMNIFSGPTAFSFSENKKCVKKLAYLVELYRRLYWRIDEKSEIEDIGYFEGSTSRVDNLTDQELINFYNTL